MFPCQRKHVSITGFKLPSESQWQYIHTSLKNEKRTFFSPVFPISQQTSTPKTRWTTAAGIWHTCVCQPPPSEGGIGIQEHGICTPSTGQGRKKECPEMQFSGLSRKKPVQSAGKRKIVPSSQPPFVNTISSPGEGREEEEGTSCLRQQPPPF